MVCHIVLAIIAVVVTCTSQWSKVLIINYEHNKKVELNFIEDIYQLTFIYKIPRSRVAL